MEIKRHRRPKYNRTMKITVNPDKSLVCDGKRYYPKEFWEHIRK